MRSHSAPKAFATSFLNLSSDQRTISVRIPLYENDFSKSFKKEWFFDKEMYTQRQNIFQELKPLTKANNDHFELKYIYIQCVSELLKVVVVDSIGSFYESFTLESPSKFKTKISDNKVISWSQTEQ